MPEVTIRLRINPETGKKDIIVSMRSDADALPHEHEQQHRAIVDKLVNGGVVKAAELGQIVVEREKDEKEPAIPSDIAPQAERKAEQMGQ
jgi:FtsH ternary system domain X3-analog